MAKKRIPRNGEHVLTTEHDGVFIVSEVDARDATVKITPVGHPNVHHVVGWETLKFLDK
jgi:hypothetical protein